MEWRGMSDRAIEKLDPEKRRALELRLEGRTQAEIGKELGHDERTIRRWLASAEVAQAEVELLTPLDDVILREVRGAVQRMVRIGHHEDPKAATPANKAIMDAGERVRARRERSGGSGPGGVVLVNVPDLGRAQELKRVIVQRMLEEGATEPLEIANAAFMKAVLMLRTLGFDEAADALLAEGTEERAWSPPALEDGEG
jgi:transposase-like protein